MSKLISFDLDKTLFFTPEPKEGQEIFKNKTGLDWPYAGWWGRKETLNLDIFEIPLNIYVYNEYLKHKADENSYVILATGRLEKKMRREVDILLDVNSIFFDEVHCNPGRDTYDFKSELFSKLIMKQKPDVFIMYDDRYEHLVKFEQWARDMPCKIEITNVVSKQTKHFN